MARSSVNQEQSHRVYDPDGDQEGCPFCEDKPCNPVLAWRAFYDGVYSLSRSSWCIGRGCKDPVWDNKEEEVDDEVTEQAEQWREQQEQVERSEVADTTEEPKTLFGAFLMCCSAISPFPPAAAYEL
jgi:hypothetical protein